MAQKKGFNDGAYGRVMLRAGDFARRVGEGTIPEERAMLGIQMLSEGNSVEQVASDSRLPSVDGLKRLVLEPDRPLKSWQQLLGIRALDWISDNELFTEPERCEIGLSEIWYDIEKPGRLIYSPEAINLLADRDLRGFTARMNFALAKEERDMVMASGMLVATSSTRRGSSNNLRLPYLEVDVGPRLCANVCWNDGSLWHERCGFPGFRKFK